MLLVAEGLSFRVVVFDVPKTNVCVGDGLSNIPLEFVGAVAIVEEGNVVRGATLIRARVVDPPLLVRDQGCSRTKSINEGGEGLYLLVVRALVKIVRVRIEQPCTVP
jgi:hypothetical protein